jgi:hypothetical protein
LPHTLNPLEVVVSVVAKLVPSMALVASRLITDHDTGLSVYIANSELLGFETKFL